MPKLVSISGIMNSVEQQNQISQGKATHNPSIWLIITKIDRIIKELADSRTANSTSSSGHDTARMDSYVSDFVRLVEHLVTEPDLDWVATHPDTWALSEEPPLPELENEDVLFALNDLIRTRREITRSQSGRNPSGIAAPDYDRMISFIGKVEDFVNNYISPKGDSGTPLDLPESSNKVPNSDIDDGSPSVGI